jgi:hypothetical protein
VSADQLELPLDIEIRPTISMQRGESRVDQCSWCGLLVCHQKRKLGACPACGSERWWPEKRPSLDGAHWCGPFYHRPASGASKETTG